EGVEFGAQEAAATWPLPGENRDVARDFRATKGELVAADCSDRGMLNRGVRPVAAFHHVGAAFVIAFLADHRTNERDRAHLGGELVEAFGELNVLYGGRNGLGSSGDLLAGMRVEGLELAGTAAQPEEDDRLGRFVRLLCLPGKQFADRS